MTSGQSPAMRIERAPEAGEFFWSTQWLGVMGNRMVNEARVFRVLENLHVGDQALFDTGGDKVWELSGIGEGTLVGLGGRDQLDFGSVSCIRTIRPGRMKAQAVRRW